VRTVVTSAGCPYPDLDDRIWRNILARANVFHAIRPRLADLFDRASASNALDSTLRQLASIADEVSEIEGDATKAVLTTLDEWRRIVAGAAQFVHLERSDANLLREIEKLLSDALSVSSMRVANPLEDTFVKVSKLSAQVYRSHRWVKPTFSLAMEIAHPRPHHSYLDPYAVSALTTSAPNVIVQLVIWPHAFGPPAYAVLPYVLIHECICHVPARQDRVDNGSTFAEGFMDWAAEHFYELWLSRIDSRLAPMTEQHVAALQQVLTGASSVDASFRRIGRRAASQLMNWISGHDPGLGRGRTVAKSAVARLALTLNTTMASLDIKDHFVSELNPTPTPDLGKRLEAWVDGELDSVDLLQCTCA
jgi:hypothetical protein